MKQIKIIAVLLILLVALLQPAPVTRSQSAPNSPLTQSPDRQITKSLKSAILANLDTINTLVEQKIITLKKENRKIKRQYIAAKNNPIIIHDTLIVFIDTCLKNIDYQLIEKDSISPEKVGWFKKLFHKRKKADHE